MPSSYSLRIFDSVLHSDALIHQVADCGRAEWVRRKAANLGDVDGSFTLYPDEADLRTAFQEWLCKDVQEKASGRVTWRGFIYSMIHTSPNGIQRELSMEHVYNRVWVKYDDAEAADGIGYDGPYENTRSQARYGVKEIVIDSKNMPDTTRAQMGAAVLANHAFPRIRVIGQGDKEGNQFTKGKYGNDQRLLIQVTGYGVTLMWEHYDEITTPTNANTAIADLASGSYIQSGGQITSNTTSVQFDTRKRPKLYQMQEIAKAGDSSNSEYWFKVDANRKLSYKPRETSPRYYLHKGIFYDSALARNAVNIRHIEPGLVRDLEWIRSAPNFHSSETSFTDARTIQGSDFYMDEVGLDHNDKLTWRITGDDLAAVRDDYKR